MLGFMNGITNSHPRSGRRRLLAAFMLLLAVFWVETSVLDTRARAHPEPAPAKCRHHLWPGEYDLAHKSDFPPPPTGDRGFDVLTYDLDLTLDPEGAHITGTVDIGLLVVSAGLDTVRLDLVDELTCTLVQGADAVLAFSHENDALRVLLPTAAAAGDTLRLTVGWEGTPPRHGRMQVGLLFRKHNAGTPDDPSDDVPIIANISEPWSAHSWWPCKDHPADKALVSCAVTVPEDLFVVSNGSLLGEEAVGPGLRRYRWSEAYPLSTYLVSVAVSNYESWFEECLGVPLEYHVFPPDRAKAEVDFAPTCDMLEFMTDLVGPYPFAGEKYAQVEIKWIGAMEHTTATSISQIFFTGDGKHETLILHELAHHWFGNSLTPGRWRDLWLNEGFARYCEALWVEHRYGPEAYRGYMHSIGKENHEEWFAGDGLLGDPSPILPNLMVYDKGGWLLHSLRQLIGDQAFFGLLHDYANEPDLVQGTVVAEDFITAAGRAAGRDLGNFFTPWLETESVPEIWWRAEYHPDGVDLQVGQLQDTVHELALPLEIQTTCGPRREMVTLHQREHLFHFSSSCPTTGVRVDPDSLVFMFRGAAPDPVLDVQVALQVGGPLPNPLHGQGGEFLLYLTAEAPVSAKIYDLRGRLVQEHDLGILGNTGPEADKHSTPHRWRLSTPSGAGPLATGVYWMEFRAGQNRVVRKFTVIN
jgi:aminopeptidase N